VRALPRVELVVEPETLERTALGTIAGHIWLRDGDAAAQGDFPEVGWPDQPVALLAAWVPALQRLSRSVPAGEEITCAFVEGPYAFSVRAEGLGRWRLRCFERRSGASADRAVQEWLTDSAHLLASALRAGRAALARCDARGWWGPETEALRRALEPTATDRR
jgi:hypothetical protein